MNDKKFKLWNRVISLIVFAISAITYLSTIEPTASFWDCGEFIASSYKLEVGHPPGNPVFQLFARFFSLWADAEHAAVAINAMNAILSALTIFFLYLTIVFFAKRLIKKKGEEYSLPESIAIFGSGAVGALVAMGAYSMGLTDEELKPLVTSWRKSNPHICSYWWKVGDAAIETITTGRTTSLEYGIRFRKDGPLLRLRLPSGRELSYVHPKYDGQNITYEGTIQKINQWGSIETYGPKLVENIVQATARDCLAESIRRLEACKFPVVFHVHDEVICEVPNGESSAEEIGDIMSGPISWAPGLLLRADAYECSYYKKD